MVQIRILSGKTAGNVHVARRFPYCIGRAAGNDLQLDDEGVWDNHLVLEVQKIEGFTVKTVSDAFVAINEQPQTSARLRNGDILSFGSAKIQFWLAAPKQRSLRLRELSLWLLLAAITAFQIFLIHQLLK
ncbi:MAG: FHA domain-containing protein [Verrucomicrobiota bacterium]